MHVCVQVLKLRLKAETGLRQLKSAEAELFRKKASLDELTVQLSLSAASLESALEEGAALEAEVAASKQQAAEANTRLEAALVETRELKVGGAKLHRPMVCDVFNSACVCVCVLREGQLRVAVAEQKWSASERVVRLGKEERVRDLNALAVAKELIESMKCVLLDIACMCLLNCCAAQGCCSGAGGACVRVV